MFVHGSNPNHHQGCLDMNQIPIIIIMDVWTCIKNNNHQGCLVMDQIATIIIKVAWTIKSLRVVIIDWTGSNPNNHHQGWLNKHTTGLISIMIRLFMSHNYEYLNFINVQAPSMMIIGIWSMYKHPWWWLLEFNSCSTINEDNFIDFTHVQKSLVIVVSFVRFGDNLTVF